MKNQNIQIAALTDLQSKLGYNFNGQINPVALLGLFGKAAEVLHKTILMSKDSSEFIYGVEFAAYSVGAIIDNIKKKNRKKKDLQIEVFVDPDGMDAFDLKLADTLYYLNILATNRGKTLGDYAELSVIKVKNKMENKSNKESEKTELEIISIENSHFYTKVMKDSRSNFLNIINDILLKSVGVLELNQENSKITFDVSLTDHLDTIEFLIADVDGYLSTTGRDNLAKLRIFDFVPAIKFYEECFGVKLVFDKAEGFFHITKK